jgi:hypothetical protein
VPDSVLTKEPVTERPRRTMFTFWRHYVEMVAVMFLGMFVLGVPLGALLGAFGIDVTAWSTNAPELALIGMAFTMTVPMLAWMRFRGHGWGPTWEMAGAMFVPAFAATALIGLAIVEDFDALMVAEHLAMLVAMLAVMLFRRDEYAGHVGHAAGS